MSFQRGESHIATSKLETKVLTNPPSDTPCLCAVPVPTTDATCVSIKRGQLFAFKATQGLLNNTPLVVGAGLLYTLCAVAGAPTTRYSGGAWTPMSCPVAKRFGEAILTGWFRETDPTIRGQRKSLGFLPCDDVELPRPDAVSGSVGSSSASASGNVTCNKLDNNEPSYGLPLEHSRQLFCT